jgi:hypothetical protein
MTPYPRARTGGVLKAPRHEIAGSGAATAQRALWGLVAAGVVAGGGLSGARAGQTCCLEAAGEIVERKKP